MRSTRRATLWTALSLLYIICRTGTAFSEPIMESFFLKLNESKHHDHLERCAESFSNQLVNTRAFKQTISREIEQVLASCVADEANPGYSKSCDLTSVSRTVDLVFEFSLEKVGKEFRFRVSAISPMDGYSKIWGDVVKGPSDDVYELCEQLGQGFLISYAPEVGKQDAVAKEGREQGDQGTQPETGETAEDTEVPSTSSGWGTSTNAGWGSQTDEEDDVDRFIGYVAGMASVAARQRDCSKMDQALKQYLKDNEAKIIEIGKSLRESDTGTKSQEREMEKAMSSFEAATASCPNAGTAVLELLRLVSGK